MWFVEGGMQVKMSIQRFQKHLELGRAVRPDIEFGVMGIELIMK